MPHITIYGTPESMSQDELERLMQEVVRTTNEVSRMDYDEKKVMVWFPPDRMAKGLGYEFAIEVACLDANLEAAELRDRDQVAQEFCNVAARFFPDYWCIECCVHPFEEHKAGHAVLAKPRTA